MAHDIAMSSGNRRANAADSFFSPIVALAVGIYVRVQRQSLGRGYWTVVEGDAAEVAIFRGDSVGWACRFRLVRADLARVSPSF